MASSLVPLPFEIHVPEAQVARLKSLVLDYDLPAEDVAPNSNWEYGVSVAWLKKLQNYWGNEFDWKVQEAKLNRFKQYKVTIEGVELHFIHEPSQNPNAVPILLTHGWPSSFYEFHQVIEPLNNPQDASQAFHVVVPSLPGFGFSSLPNKQNWTVKDTARIFNILMTEILGYKEYVLQGGDWGSVVSTHLTTYPGAKAIHLNNCGAKPRFAPLLGLIHFLTPSSFSQRFFKWWFSTEEYDGLAISLYFLKFGFGYFVTQATQPLTIGYALNDSPMGQLCWIGEKYHSLVDRQCELTDDMLLTTLSIYFFSRSFATSCLIYSQNLSVLSDPPIRIKDIPLGVSIFPRDVLGNPESWVKQEHPGLCFHRRHHRGGHFAALENPDALVNDVREFVQTNLGKIRSEKDV